MLSVFFVVVGAAAAPTTAVRAMEGHANRLRALDVRPSTLTRFIEETIDLEEVSAHLLGPHRRSFSKEQRREFERLFVAILVGRAWQRAEVLNDFESRCTAAERSQVRCRLRRGEDEVTAVFTVNGTRVVDARVGDMGMVRENCAAIDRLIRARGVDGLLERMRKKANDLHDRRQPRHPRHR